MRVRHDRKGLPYIGPLASFDEEDGSSPQDPSAASPALFVHPIVTRPSLPWDQAQAARLEARHNAPLPLSEVTFLLKRQGAWRPGSPGRFAAVYARHSDVEGGLVATVDVDGAPTEVRFTPPGQHIARAQHLAILAAVGGVSMTLVGATAIALVTSRLAAESELSLFEQAVADRQAQAELLSAQQRQHQALLEAGLGDHRASRVIADLAWATRTKNPAAGIEAAYWEDGMLAVEVRGEEAPFSQTDRTLQRADRPVRPGVWLWGVTQAPATSITPR